MESMMTRKRQLAKRRMLRWLVIAAVYCGLLMGAITLFLGCIWLVKNTVHGWWLLLALCSVMGCVLFFRITQEGTVRGNLQYS